MIARLRGEVMEVGPGRVVVEAGGVGYEVLVPDAYLSFIPGEGERADLHIRQVFRENEVTLYGFLDAEQRRLFDMLTEVKGCGPRTSQSLLGQLGLDGVVSAIVSQDAKMLARAQGVGPRLAERIILELREKVQQDALYRKAAATSAKPVGNGRAARADDDLVEALLALGYRRAEAEAAAEEVREAPGGVEGQVKAALARLSR